MNLLALLFSISQAALFVVLLCVLESSSRRSRAEKIAAQLAGIKTSLEDLSACGVDQIHALAISLDDKSDTHDRAEAQHGQLTQEPLNDGHALNLLSRGQTDNMGFCNQDERTTSAQSNL